MAASATVYVSLAAEDLQAIEDLTAATDALTETLDDYVDITTDTTVEFGELLETGTDRVSRLCEIVTTAALVVIALALLCR